MNYFFKEPINKRIMSLLIVFIAAVILIVFLNNSRSELDFELNKKLDDARNGQMLSSKIIVDLHYLHSQILNFMKPDSLVMMFPHLDNDKIFSKMEMLIDEIQGVLNVLKDYDQYRGGFFDDDKNPSADLKHSRGFDSKNIDLLDGITDKLFEVENFIYKIQKFEDIKSIIPNPKAYVENTLVVELIGNQGTLHEMIGQIETYFFMQIKMISKLKKEGEIQSRRYYQTYLYSFILIVLFVLLFGIRILIQITDIIEKRDKAEFDIKSAKEYAENLYKIIPSAIFTVDKNKIITNWNLRAEEITGYSYSEVIGKSCVVFAEMPCKCGCSILDDYKGIPIICKECLIKTKSGEFRNVSKSAIALKDENDNLIGAIESFTDITGQKNVQKNLELAMHKAKDSARVKSEFLANMSHELRTPMNSIIGFSDLLKDTKLGEKQRVFIDSISENGTILIDLINDVLDMSKLEVRKLDLELVKFNFKELVINVFNQIKLKHNNSKVDFEVDIDPNIPDFLIGDSVRVRQVFVNLLDNASKFTKEGNIFLKTSISCEKNTTSLDTELFLDIYLKDTGIGISKEKQELVFNPFTQADSSTTRKFGGTGLGLSIVKSLVEMMDGSIILNSVEKEGSEFLLTLKFQRVSDTPLGN